jgi:hypothetical protein
MTHFSTNYFGAFFAEDQVPEAGLLHCRK